jgi:hypothetical protein
LFTKGGHHWIIENNTVRQVNSVGIEIGFSIFESRDRRFTHRTDPDLGHHIVRNNRISECGSAGIRGLHVSHALVENNFIHDCGWQDAEFHWEVAGIKLLVNRGTLVKYNRIFRIQGGCGIWMDWDNQYSRVTTNIIHDISSVQGAIFVEASQIPNLVDHNFLWNIDGPGVRVADSDNTLIAHNLFGYVSGELVVAKVATDRTLNGRRLTSTRNRFLNNLVIDQGKPIDSSDPSNVADHNVYVSTHENSAPVKDSGEHSISIYAEVQFDPVEMQLSWKIAQPLPTVPAVDYCAEDFFKRKRTVGNTVAGPFTALTNSATLQMADPEGE